MRHVSIAVAAALAACASSDVLGRDKAHTANKNTDKLDPYIRAYHTQGRYFGDPGETVTFENFHLSALGDGLATYSDALETDWTWAFRVDFEARSADTGETRADSFDLSFDLSGYFDGTGMSGFFGGSGATSPNGGTLMGVPVFDGMSAAPGVMRLELDQPLGALGAGESLNASFIDTVSQGSDNAGLLIAAAYGGDTQYVSFVGDSTWTEIPAPGGPVLLGSVSAWAMVRRRRRATS